MMFIRLYCLSTRRHRAIASYAEDRLPSGRNCRMTLPVKHDRPTLKECLTGIAQAQAWPSL